jgi:alkanesulfonate monooxygenase SsuD/methylene tetrahydromethanopterin reductase-like flavin-dependent oxidoreductase (luciferase family)
MAEERRDLLDRLVDPELALAITSSHLGIDLSSFALDEPLDVLARDQTVGGALDVLMAAQKAEGLTLRQAAQRYGTSCMAPQLVGTAESVADTMEDLFRSGACDGFILTPTTFPGMFEQFARSVIPALQRRGIYRTAYTGATLRENLRT